MEGGEEVGEQGGLGRASSFACQVHMWDAECWSKHSDDRKVDSEMCERHGNAEVGDMAYSQS